MKIFNIIYSTLFNKCPRCHQGQVFKEANPYKLSKIFSLYERCSHCALKYEREPSFFYGAMYVSYALTSGWFIVWYFIYLFYLNSFDTLYFALIVSFSILILSPLTLRLSRLIWLNFFFGFKKELQQPKIKKQND
jgi:uncharacterized protein (DUF983 family)